jgi:hypothetical protein
MNATNQSSAAGASVGLTAPQGAADVPPAAKHETAWPPGHGPSSFWVSVRRVLRQPRFIAAALVLLVCAVGLNAATGFLQLHFRKVAVPLRVKSLDDPKEGIPSKIGHWLQVSVDERMSEDVEHELGTKTYLNREYMDTRLERRAAIEFDKKTAPERRRLIDDITYQQQVQDADRVPVLKFHMAYYTGLVDTVAHIPDRCMVADGYVPTNHEDVDAEVGTLADGSPRKLRFRFITFEDNTGQQRVGRNVVYFFHVNGRYESNPLQVRYTLQNLLETHGYYAKVELMSTVANPNNQPNKQKVKEAMIDFLKDALPDIERCLPDFEKVKAEATASAAQKK